MTMSNEKCIDEQAMSDVEYKNLNDIADQMARKKLPTRFVAVLHPADSSLQPIRNTNPITFPIPDDMQVEVYDFIAKCIRLRLGEYKAALLARLQDIDATIKEEIPE